MMIWCSILCQRFLWHHYDYLHPSRGRTGGGLWAGLRFLVRKKPAISDAKLSSVFYLLRYFLFPAHRSKKSCIMTIWKSCIFSLQKLNSSMVWLHTAILSSWKALIKSAFFFYHESSIRERYRLVGGKILVGTYIYLSYSKKVDSLDCLLLQVLLLLMLWWFSTWRFSTVFIFAPNDKKIICRYLG